MLCFVDHDIYRRDKERQMISGSVAVEGQGRSLGPVLGQPPPVAEFLRPLPRTAPYVRYPHQLSQASQLSQLSALSQSRLRDDDEPPSTAPAYPPVPGAYHRYLPHPFSPYYPQYQPPPPPIAPPPVRSPPRGKEGSLKHRLLSREQVPTSVRFSRGALIQLGSGELRRVEEMRTEDFIQSAERSPELRLTKSTVKRLLRRPAADSVTLTLRYNDNRSEADMEYPVEHPFFVYDCGWASCSPERTMQCYGLAVNRLQVGDVCVSLIRRDTPLPPTSAPHLPPPPPPAPHNYMIHQPTSATIVTTATTTAMTVRPADAPQSYPENLSLREDSRKRRWSAPDICDEDSPTPPRTMRH